MSAKYDYIIVGSGLFGAICAYELKRAGKSVLVLEKRTHVGGNCYTENKRNIHVHRYGPHIFHTNEKWIWDYINQFAEFNDFKNTPIANYKGELHSLPFNMWTFNKIWGVTSPKEAMEIIESQKFEGKITNLKEQAISLVGRDVYEMLIEGYTEKQWGKKCTELPPSIIKRIPVRFNWDNNYFNDKYQGIPIGGYTQIFNKLLDGINVYLDCDYLSEKEYWDDKAGHIIYTGPIDEYFEYKYGDLEYRSLYWRDSDMYHDDNFQGNAIVNYTDATTPFTRTIEHKHFDNQNQKGTIVSWEYPDNYVRGKIPYYPINDDKNNELYKKYKTESLGLKNVTFCGRLAEYKYYDMHQIIASALKKVKDILENSK